MELCELDNVQTHFFTYDVASNDEPIYAPNSSCQLYFVPFPNPTMPKKRRGLQFLALTMVRVWALLVFAIHVMWRGKSLSPDIVHIHSPMHFLLALWGKAMGAKTIITLHGTDFVRIVQFKPYRYLLSVYDVIACVTNHQVDALKTIMPNKDLVLVSNGVDVEYFNNEKKKPNSYQITAVGTLRWHKDFSTLILAFKKLYEQFPEWKLTIYGEGPLRSNLEQEIENLGLKDNVSLPGSISRGELRDALAATKIFCVSSVTEGLPKVLLEAMASGCACISTDVGDCAWILDGTGLIVPPGESGQLANALKLMASLGEEANLRGQAAKKRVADFSWDKYRESHRALYAKLA